MRIDSSELSFGKESVSAASQAGRAGDFADVLRVFAEKQARPRNLSPEERARQRLDAARTEHQALFKELSDYLAKSPAEHLRDAVMKEMGLTEEKLQAMSPEDCQAAEAEINRRIREHLLGKREGDADGEGIAAATGSNCMADDAATAPQAGLGSAIANLQPAANS